MTRRVAVVGGGVTGLAAAYELGRLAPDVEVVVHEAAGRVGGKVRTTAFAGRPVDEGADAFLARLPWAVDLCRELGLAGDLVTPARRSAYVFCDGALRRLPSGLVLGVPTDLEAVAASGIVPGPVAARPAPAPLAPGADITIGALVRQQLGDDVLERLVDPLLGGINAGDCDRLSARAAAPRLAEAAERSADLVGALRAELPSDPAAPLFYAPRGGMGALVHALVGALAAAGARVCTGSPVVDLGALDADAVVVALPAHLAAPLAARAGARSAADRLASVPYASVAVVTLAYSAEAVDRALDASGFLVPRTEGMLVTAVSWATSKWPHLTPDDGRVIVRASAGRLGDERIAGLDDRALVDAVHRELTATMDVTTRPDEVRVSRWDRSFPQYGLGHLDLVDEVESDVAEQLPTVVLAGAAFRGLGVPACIRDGRRGARAAVRALGTVTGPAP
ncbi:MAG: protoporphyrinogen oxidase [Acidimicrobiia bacterium]